MLGLLSFAVEKPSSFHKKKKMVVKLNLEVLSMGPSWERLQNWKLRQSIV